MIEHIFIKNYKAFKKENIPLDKNTLLIGTNSSGKTTVLEALDLFFNNVFNVEYVINRDHDVIIEIHINDERYRKVYKAPNYAVDYKKCIGNMFDINKIKYLYVPKKINNATLLNDILSINMASKIDSTEQARVYKVSDYIDGTLGNSNYKLFKIDTRYEMDIDEDVRYTKEDYCRIVSNITYPFLVIGIDNFEDNFIVDGLKKITKYSYQTIFSTNDSEIVKNWEYYVSTLYKGNKIDDFDTIKKRIHPSFKKKYILVEGKYDVAWFERAVKVLGLEKHYSIIPCGGSGNITFVKEQLEKENFETIVITDGDTKFKGALKKDVIELYADIQYINSRFGTKFKSLPEKKHVFFKQFNVKDDVVKNVLSRWARKHLEKDSEFVQEIKVLLKGEK
ncbi:AAA family ATPase [Candidatus Izimaplasma bacterium]|nr:AAA family ATPase [Candidatus Izimaplasma bacterium]